MISALLANPATPSRSAARSVAPYLALRCFSLYLLFTE